jgi:hypothetical protein
MGAARRDLYSSFRMAKGWGGFSPGEEVFKEALRGSFGGKDCRDGIADSLAEDIEVPHHRAEGLRVAHFPVQAGGAMISRMPRAWRCACR